MINTDRRDIAKLLSQWFPTMANATSNEWHFFLDKMTGLNTPLDMPNAQAFDRWREALAAQGFPVFPYTDESVAAMKLKAEKLLKKEQDRAAKLGKTLADLAKEAPNWSVADMMAVK